MKKFSLSLDDFSSHPKAGKNFESIEWCDKLIEKYPDFKINLFIPAAYGRLNETTYPLPLCKDWLKQVGKLPAKNYRLNYHGFHHRRISKKYGNSNNDEWQFLNEREALELTKKMIDMFNMARLPMFKTFRPPGWKISASAAKILTEKGFIIAGDDWHYKLFKNKVSGLKWVSWNWEMITECKLKNCDIVAVGHTSNWCPNFMNEERLNLILKLLDREQFEFRFIEEML